jgi:hypothetical protein
MRIRLRTGKSSIFFFECYHQPKYPGLVFGALILMNKHLRLDWDNYAASIGIMFQELLTHILLQAKKNLNFYSEYLELL